MSEFKTEKEVWHIIRQNERTLVSRAPSICGWLLRLMIYIRDGEYKEYDDTEDREYFFKHYVPTGKLWDEKNKQFV